jgi:uncharacterized protein (DUF952 family)
MSETSIYHMCRADEWAAAQASGSYPGSSQDVADGFIHFSTGAQVRESAAKHRAGQDGQLFPHLYGALPADAVLRADPLPLGADGLHLFPDHVSDG